MISISASLPEMWSDVTEGLPPHLHHEMTDALPLTVHGAAGLTARPVLDLEGGEVSLPQPLSVLHTLQLPGHRRSLRGEGQEVEREAVD